MIQTRSQFEAAREAIIDHITKAAELADRNGLRVTIAGKYVSTYLPRSGDENLKITVSMTWDE
jgi:hypothetical protein